MHYNARRFTVRDAQEDIHIMLYTNSMVQVSLDKKLIPIKKMHGITQVWPNQSVRIQIESS